MDRARDLLSQGRWGERMGDMTLQQGIQTDGLNDAFSGQHRGWDTEDLFRRKSISREDQDRWALRSQERFAKAQAAGHFEAEIAIVEVPRRKGTTPFRNDQHNRPDTSAESLARLKPAFRRDGSITAGSALGQNTGAGASSAVGAQMERVEINEAFAAITLACLRELGFNEAVVNVDGGAIAHGHPIGSSGAVLTTRLLHAMQRDGLRRGLVTLCIRGGQGNALALERV